MSTTSTLGEPKSASKEGKAVVLKSDASRFRLGSILIIDTHNTKAGTAVRRQVSGARDTARSYHADSVIALGREMGQVVKRLRCRGHGRYP